MHREFEVTSIAELISLSGKSMAAIARECGLSISHISRICHRNRTPSITVCRKLAISLDVPLAAVVAAIAHHHTQRQRVRVRKAA